VIDFVDGQAVIGFEYVNREQAAAGGLTQPIGTAS